LIAIALGLALPAAALADKVLLADGRVLVGRFVQDDRGARVIQGDQVQAVDPDSVLEILTSDQLADILDQHLAEIDPTDLTSLAQLARQAQRDGLADQAQQLWLDILEIDPEHEVARRELGYVRLGRQWLPFERAINDLPTLDDQHSPEEIRATVSGLEALARTPRRLQAVRELKGRLHLVRREFDQAVTVFQAAAEKARQAEDAAAALRFQTLSGIVAESPRGIYPLAEAYPGQSVLFDHRGPRLQPGPVSLSDPLAIDAALRDAAVTHRDDARQLIEQAAKAENIDPEAARAKYGRAHLALDRADALVEGIGDSYRVEIARRRIAALRRDVESEARQYDAQEEKLGTRELSDRAYKRLLARMVHHLDSLEEILEEILTIARPYRRELILEVQWAETDLHTVRGKRTILKDEMHDR
jgi:tetratricopeptide (TPR) repeat protein